MMQRTRFIFYVLAVASTVFAICDSNAFLAAWDGAIAMAWYMRIIEVDERDRWKRLPAARVGRL